MLSWFIFSIISVVLLGIAMSFYKLPSVKNQSSTATTTWTLFFSLLFSVIIFSKHITEIDSEMLLLAALWGFSFSVLSSLQMHALKHVDTNVLFPITTTLSLMFSVLIGITLFPESLSIIQMFGTAFSILSVYLFIYKRGKIQYSLYLVYIGLAVLFMSVFNKIIQKLAADSVNIETYLIYQYLFAAIFAFILFIFYNKGNFKNNLFSGAVKSGLFISIPAFFGGWALMTALVKGPFALVTTVHSMYIFITALMGYLFFKEKLTKKKIALLILAVLSMIIIKLG